MKSEQYLADTTCKWCTQRHSKHTWIHADQHDNIMPEYRIVLLELIAKAGNAKQHRTHWSCPALRIRFFNHKTPPSNPTSPSAAITGMCRWSVCPHMSTADKQLFTLQSMPCPTQLVAARLSYGIKTQALGRKPQGSTELDGQSIQGVSLLIVAPSSTVSGLACASDTKPPPRLTVRAAIPQQTWLKPN